MKFDELNEDNFLLFAVKHYQNTSACTEDDFYNDLKRFRYIKRLLRRYLTKNELETHLLLNHFVLLYNIFGDAATPMLFFKIEQMYWPAMKTFICFLGRLPQFPKTIIHDIETDQYCMEKLNGL